MTNFSQPNINNDINLDVNHIPNQENSNNFKEPFLNNSSDALNTK